MINPLTEKNLTPGKKYAVWVPTAMRQVVAECLPTKDRFEVCEVIVLSFGNIQGNILRCGDYSVVAEYDFEEHGTYERV